MIKSQAYIETKIVFPTHYYDEDGQPIENVEIKEKKYLKQLKQYKNATKK